MGGFAWVHLKVLVGVLSSNGVVLFFYPSITLKTGERVMQKRGTILLLFHTCIPELQLALPRPFCGYPSRLGAQTIRPLLCSVPAGAQDGHSELKKLEDMQRQTAHNQNHQI